MLKRTCSLEAAVKNFTGIDTRPKEMVPLAMARAGMAATMLARPGGPAPKEVTENGREAPPYARNHVVYRNVTVAWQGAEKHPATEKYPCPRGSTDCGGAKTPHKEGVLRTGLALTRAETHV